MKDKHPQPTKLTDQELQLIEQLRKRPELLERFRSILEISASGEGPIKKADEIEALLIEEMRRLGNATMTSWASGAENTLAEPLVKKEPPAAVRKKKR
jgi:hypothetical protein